MGRLMERVEWGGGVKGQEGRNDEKRVRGAGRKGKGLEDKGTLSVKEGVADGKVER